MKTRQPTDAWWMGTAVALNDAGFAAEPGWRGTRQVVLARDSYRCRDCTEHHEPGDLDVHHLIPRAAGGGDSAANLVTLCDGCHGRRHPNLQVSLSRRMIERWAIRLALSFDRRSELPDELHALTAALRLLGKERLREGQLDAVLAALRGESMLVVRPTGAGKSLCFQLPALLTDGTTYVLSPLKALMKDQVAELQRLKLPGTFINSDLGPDEKRQRYELLDQGALKFLYCTPERFNAERVRAEEVARLTRQRPAFLVVDEAHCVDRWGNDFRPDYDRINEIRNALGNPPVLAFTATAGVDTRKRILESLGAKEATQLISGADRPNIALVRHQMPGHMKNAGHVRARARLIGHLVQTLPEGRAMIFVPTVKVGHALKAALAEDGLNLPFYHAKLATANERDMIIGRFTGRLDGEAPLRAVICTNAFGMGLDVPDVRLVINWQHPSSVEDYLQEFGRAGRDGKPALAVLLTEGGPERGLLEFMARTTADNADDPVHAQKGLELRIKQIDEINELVVRRACFRSGLLTTLMGNDPKSRRSLARRVLDLAFGEKRRVTKSYFCCDACHPKKAARALQGFR